MMQGTMMRKIIVVASLAALAALNGCDRNSNILEAAPSGTVVQGPVSGANVWADRITAALPQGNGVQDADEETTTTDVNGKFKYKKKPDYAYINRSRGGTDTVTNKPALPLASPAGSDTVTPTTTMVASLPPNPDGTLSPRQTALVAKIELIMGSEHYDADPSKQLTPAALALNKSIESAMTIVAQTVDTAAGAAPITTAQLDKVMTTVATAIATELEKPTTTTATLTSAASLSTVVGTATQAAATTINNTANTNIVFADTAVMAAAVKDATQAVCTAIADKTGNTGDSLGSAANTKTPEATVVQQIVNVITASENVAVDTSVDTVVAVEVKTDTTAPEVANAGTAVTPASGASAVPVNSPITISFTKDMDPNTLTGATFSIAAPGGAAVAATISYNSASNTAILTPSAPLSANVSYTVTCTTGAKDLSAKLGIAANKVWSFTTAVAPDTTPPTVTLSPANGATGIAADAIVEATFNKAITKATLTTTSFKVTTAAGTVQGVVKYDASTNKATFSPALPLTLGATYTVTLSGITSLSGVALANTTSTFTTAGSVDTVKPTATLATSSGATVSVPVTATVLATFDKQMDVTTINTTNFTLKLNNSVAVAGTVQYNSVTKTATFTPSAALSNGSYTATITTGAKDTSGNLLAAQQTLTFLVGLTGATGTGGTGARFNL